MKKLLILSLLALGYQSASAQLVTESFGSGVNAFSMDFVTIGNPNNAADTRGSPNPAGSVAYVYNMGMYEVSRDIVLKASTAGGLQLTLADMTGYGGNGSSHPATGISWNEAGRFVNYLNTSKGYQAAYNFTTSGANANITLWGAGQYSGSNQFRHKDAHFFLPSENEWYKSAYGSPNGTWHNFANGSDIAPTAVSGGTSGAVYNVFGTADITYAGGLSPYGTMAQCGNAWEWNEGAFDGINDSATEFRVLRGGSWSNDSSLLNASFRNFFFEPTNEYIQFGFRIAMIPEPSSLSLLLIGMAGMASRRLLKRKD